MAIDNLDGNILKFYKEILQAWEQIRYCPTTKYINIGSNESNDMLKEIGTTNLYCSISIHCFIKIGMTVEYCI